MDICLTLTEGGKPVAIRPRLPSVIGRNAEADLQVPDSQVSRRHCELYEYEGQLAVRDIGSVNGTTVNGHKIEQDTFLSTGDTIGIGRVTFQVEIGVADPESFPPSEEQAASDSGVVMVESEAEPASVAAGGSAALSYQSSDEGSFIGISDAAPADNTAAMAPADEEEDDDDDGLSDFLDGLG